MRGGEVRRITAHYEQFMVGKGFSFEGFGLVLDISSSYLWSVKIVKLSPRSTATIAASGVGATARLFPHMGWSSAIGKGRRQKDRRESVPGVAEDYTGRLQLLSGKEIEWGT
ncbi:hypothetical protein Tco_1400172 [Tanacetum coccineum]